ncbi:hypothetical protein MUK42_30532 [Musa troglodytarum]|uniref:Uncharacterized protein n=1 Tax=Musa troglodytarum TaxID=320322 RepID=A0A9E7JJE7_9LILI|nr:hypothetical protein MUK42_30532 [Musa troglodytarum]
MLNLSFSHMGEVTIKEGGGGGGQDTDASQLAGYWMSLRPSMQLLV